VRKSFVLCLVLLESLLTVSLQARPADEKPSADSLAAQVDSLIVPLIQPGGPGCVVAVIRDGKTIFERSYGLANLDWNIPNSPATVFDLCSISKQFTAACVVLLAEEGKLSLDDDIRKWIPEMRDYGTKITLRHLLNHTSGIRDSNGLIVAANMDGMSTAWEPQQIFDLIFRQKALNFIPGEKFSYSNSNYDLLAEIVRRISGRTIGQFAEERIFQPLGMKHTFYYEKLRQVVKNRATGYDFAPDSMLYTSGFCDRIYGVGSGGVHSTAGDLALWNDNLYRNKLGGPHFLETMLTRPVLTSGDTSDYACGLQIGNHRGLPAVSHGGGQPGFMHNMIYFPRQKITIVILNNFNNIAVESISYDIADIYLDDQFPEDQRPPKKKAVEPSAMPAGVPVDPRLLDAYTGQYQINDLDLVRTVSREGAELFVQFNALGLPRLQLHAESDSSFNTIISDIKIRVLFQRDETGRVSRLLWRNRWQELPFERINEPRMSAEELARFCGDYYSDELQTTWNINAQDGGLVVHAPMKEIRQMTGREPLLRKKDGRFKLSGIGMLLNFIRDDKGQATGFELTFNEDFVKVMFTRK
jgi:CubicO group peptidase (beta-lactamase class C family)